MTANLYYVSYNGQRLTQSLDYHEALHIAAMHNHDNLIRDINTNKNAFREAIAEVILENGKVKQ